MLERWSPVPKTIVATIHSRPEPSSRPDFYDDLRRLNSAIVMYQRDQSFLEQYVKSGKVAFIRHGVDIEFFTPAVGDFPGPRRLLYIGINGRDLRMLEEVMQSLAAAEPELQFDFVVPRGLPALRKLWGHRNITWHRHISDEALRSLYQGSYLLLLPLITSGANNAVVEALACGLPPVTTDVGGIRDYGGGTLYPLVAQGDAPAMVSLIRDYLHDPVWRSRVGRACRAFAEEQLRWPLIAQQHLEFYRRLLTEQ
ncbi:MAG TPA: glycosyltransferase family 4 protein, partial [Nitrospira sp.]|nr:glycosyltransferase family 4 protein [Nitrospira sp.]